MPATVYPSTLGFTWGITTEETGLAVASVRQNDSTQIFEQKDNQGETIAVVSHDLKAEITIEGEITGAFTWAAGVPIVVANILAIGGVAAGLVMCKNIEITQSREAMKKCTVNATMYPLIPA
jgi:hypothetical protein